MQRPPRKRSATRTVKRYWNRRSAVRARLSRQTHTTRLIQRPNTKTRVQLPSRLSMVVSIVAELLAPRTSENIRQTPSSLPSSSEHSRASRCLWDRTPPERRQSAQIPTSLLQSALASTCPCYHFP